MRMFIEQIVLLFLAGGLGFSIGMMISPFVEKALEKTLGPPMPQGEDTLARYH